LEACLLSRAYEIWYAANEFSAAEDGGTHIDAPLHFAEGRRSAAEMMCAWEKTAHSAGPFIAAWNAPEELDAFLKAGGTGFIFKHSTRCPVSAYVNGEFLEFLRQNPSVPSYLVLVIENRPASLAVAEKLGVPHASPQAILVRGGKQVWHASHGSITAAALNGAWQAAHGT
jgi:bacillithiol system protein YtxJ